MRPMKRLDWRNPVAILLLWAFFAQAVTSMVVQSATVDEQAHLLRGYLYLKLGTPVFKIAHPILADVLSGLPLLLTNLTIPADPAAFQAIERFLVGADPHHPVAVLENGADIDAGEMSAHEISPRRCSLPQRFASMATIFSRICSYCSRSMG